MTNRTILLAPNSITEIPVSCMEQGRWHHQTDHFSPAPQHAPSKVRRKARETENRASYVAESRGPGSRSSYRDLAQAQGEVWEEIREFEDKLGTSSDTGALNTMYEERRERMRDWTRAFPLMEGQIGLAAFQGTAPLAMDALESPSLYGKVHERLLTGYVMDAMESWDPEGPSPRPVQADGEKFMTALGEAERALRKAELAQGDDLYRSYLVYMADRRIQIARTMAEREQYEKVLDELTKEHSNMLIKASQLEADQARLEAEEALLLVATTAEDAQRAL